MSRPPNVRWLKTWLWRSTNPQIGPSVCCQSSGSAEPARSSTRMPVPARPRTMSLATRPKSDRSIRYWSRRTIPSVPGPRRRTPRARARAKSPRPRATERCRRLLRQRDTTGARCQRRGRSRTKIESDGDLPVAGVEEALAGVAGPVRVLPVVAADFAFESGAVRQARRADAPARGRERLVVAARGPPHHVAAR